MPFLLMYFELFFSRFVSIASTQWTHRSSVFHSLSVRRAIGVAYLRVTYIHEVRLRTVLVTGWDRLGVAGVG